MRRLEPLTDHVSIPYRNGPFALVLRPRGGCRSAWRSWRRPPTATSEIPAAGRPGYDARHTSIEGSPIPRISGGRRGDHPTVGALQTVQSPDDPEAGYRSRLRATKRGGAAELPVLLKDSRRESRTDGYRARRFPPLYLPASEEANLIFNIGTKMGESGPARDASVTFTEDGRIEAGW